MKPTEKYTSQSEAKRALECGLAWFGEWWLDYRQSGDESMPQRVGSLGHAYIAEHVIAEHENREPKYTEALLAECKKRRYVRDDMHHLIEASDELFPDINAATRGAQVLLGSGEFNPRRVTIHNSAPMIEQRLQIRWLALSTAGLCAAQFPVAFRSHRAGIEGTPDIVHEPDRSTLFCDDYKFRQKPDLGGTVDNPDPSIPDMQGAFYKMLLRGAGIGVGREVIFRQLNVYAGRWLTAEDLLAEGSPYITEHGLPSVDFKTLGALIKPEDYETAWRVLVERRRITSLSAVTAAGKKKPVRMASEAESYTFSKFLDTLRRWPLVQVVTMRLDHSVCLDVVRDMLAAVSALVVQADAGQVPGRHLRSYATSPCMRPYGCSIQAPCRAAIGTGNVQATLTEMASDGRLHLKTTPGTIGDHPHNRSTMDITA